MSFSTLLSLSSDKRAPAPLDASTPLRVEGVSKDFRSGARVPWGNGKRRVVHAVSNVSFSIMPGEIFGLIGANGSGKSTLIRILSSLVLADNGQVRVFGYDIERQSMQARQL